LGTKNQFVTTFTERMSREEAERLTKILEEKEIDRQKNVKDKFISIKDKINDIELAFEYVTASREQLIDQTESKRFQATIDSKIGATTHGSVEEVLNQINDQKLDKFKNIDEYSKGPWMKLKEFEKSLKNSEQSQAILFKKMQDFYERKLKLIQERAAFREEAMEQALLNLKLK
jgi:cation transport regulator ChaC